LHFDEDRWTKPFLPEWLLQQTFGEAYDRIKSVFFKEGQFVSELNTQQKIEAYCSKHNIDAAIKTKLFDLLTNVILLRDEKNHTQYHFRIHMHSTASYQSLDAHEKSVLDALYVKYFFENQNELWYKEALHKLDAIQQSSNMMICAEDLGMVPPMVEGVLKSREMLALQVQRMPKSSYDQFAHPEHAPYLSVVTPSTHDMSTVRQWWEEDRAVTQQFYNQQLHQQGVAPAHCETWVCKKIVEQHLQSPAMWSVFLMQDVLAMDEQTRNPNVHDERINNPADPHHYWNYRMHLTLDDLIQQTTLNSTLSEMIITSGRNESNI
jgi:4-alpha-glucanotransferase